MPEVEHLSASYGVQAVEIPYSSEVGTGVESLAIPPSRELVMIRSSHDTTMARSSSGSGVTHELVWPCPGESGMARFILHDEEEVRLWHLLKERGQLMESNLTLAMAKLKEALERVELVHQAMTVNLPCVVEVSFLRSWCCL